MNMELGQKKDLGDFANIKSNTLHSNVCGV